jgi:hypothetical protein
MVYRFSLSEDVVTVENWKSFVLTKFMSLAKNDENLSRNTK